MAFNWLKNTKNTKNTKKKRKDYLLQREMRIMSENIK
ncbi:MAG: hypothetical protein ACJAYB_003351 [Psychromonas sp.]|jgi:hypothetical protein